MLLLFVVLGSYAYTYAYVASAVESYLRMSPVKFQQLHNQSTVHIHTGSPSSVEKHSVKVSLKDPLTFKRKRDKPTNYRTETESKTTTDIHQYYIFKTFSSAEEIESNVKYSEYNTEKNLVFCRMGLGLVSIRFSGKEDIYEIPKEGRDALSNVDSWPRGQLSDNICEATVGNKLDYLNITIQLKGEVEAIKKLGIYRQYKRASTNI